MKSIVSSLGVTSVIAFCATQIVFSQWAPIFSLKPCGSDSSFYSVHFFDHDYAFAVGENGNAFRSTDGGSNFIPMSLNINVDLYKVRFTSENIGYICGDKGTIAITTDGGINWNTKQLSGFDQSALYAMEWITPQIGLIAGGSSIVAHGQIGTPAGFILRTLDAGKTWTTVLQDQTNFFWSLGVQRKPDGKVIPHITSYGPLNGGRIQFSTDEGATWIIASTQLQFLPHDISFLPHTGVVVGGNPFDFNAGPAIAYQLDLAHWSLIPDTLSTKGFAWSVEAFISDTIIAKAQSAWTVLVGLNSGFILISKGPISEKINSINVSRRISPCALYDFAVHRKVINNGWRWETTMLAAGSGHGLFRDSKAIIVVPDRVENLTDENFSIKDVYPNPITFSDRTWVNIVYSIASDRSSANRVRLFIVDQLGRTVDELFNAQVEKGVHNIQYDASKLINGMYRIIIQNKDKTFSKPFIVLK